MLNKNLGFTKINTLQFEYDSSKRERRQAGRKICAEKNCPTVTKTNDRIHSLGSFSTAWQNFSATASQGIVSLRLTPQETRRKFRRLIDAFRPGADQKISASLSRGEKCSICRAGPCSASIPNARPEAIGCESERQAPNTAVTAMLRFIMCRRRLARDCGCVPGRSEAIALWVVRQGARANGSSRICWVRSPSRWFASRITGTRPRRSSSISYSHIQAVPRQND
jgi:hypothetical protein